MLSQQHADGLSGGEAGEFVGHAVRDSERRSRFIAIHLRTLPAITNEMAITNIRARDFQRDDWRDQVSIIRRMPIIQKAVKSTMLKARRIGLSLGQNIAQSYRSNTRTVSPEGE